MWAVPPLLRDTLVASSAGYPTGGRVDAHATGGRPSLFRRGSWAAARQSWGACPPSSAGGPGQMSTGPALGGARSADGGLRLGGPEDRLKPCGDTPSWVAAPVVSVPRR